MKKRFLSKIVTAILALAMALSLCACGGGDGGGGGSSSGNKEKKVRLEHVYSIDYLDVDMPKDFSINNLFTANGSLYLYGYYSRQLSAEKYESGTALYSVNLDGTDFKEVLLFPNEYTQPDENATSYTYTNVSNLTADANGNIWMYKQTSFEDWSDPENYVYTTEGCIVCMNPAGEEIKNFPLDKLFQDSEYYYIQQMMITSDGSLLIFSEQDLFFLSTNDGSVKSKAKLEEGTYLNSLTMLGNGDIVTMTYNYNEMTYEQTTSFAKINPATGALEDLGEAPLTNMYYMLPGPDSSIYVVNNSSMFQYDISSQQLAEKLNWINSDINFNRLQNMTVLSDGRLITIEYSRDYSNSKIMILSPKPDSEVTEKYLLSYAALYTDDTITDAIIQFNKTNDEYRIELLDYSQYNTNEDWEAGYTKLSSDIISGNIPDIFSLESMPFNNFVSKGLLADIGALMESDESFNRADYLENVLDATSVNGKIYSVIPYFNINTVVGKTENVGSELSWTIDDLKALMAKYPDAAVFSEIDKNGVLSYLSEMGIDQFVNFEDVTCSFNSSDFIGMLEFINTFPDEFDWENYYGDKEEWWQIYESQYRDNRTLLYRCYLNYYDQVRELMYNFGGENFTFVGFPTSDGIGSSIAPRLELGISAKTKHPDVCWDFVKYMLSDDYQENISWGFPIKLSCLEQMAKNAMDSGYYGGGVASGGDIIVYDVAKLDETADTDDTTDDTDVDTDVSTDTASSGDLSVDNDVSIAVPGAGSYDDYYSKPLTQAQIDKVTELVRSVSTVMRKNTDILNIITEEAAAYFAGQKTAAAVAEIIQSKVQIYVSENS